MSHIEILLPFGLPPNNRGHELLQQLPMPALAACVSRCRRVFRSPDFDPLARVLPHEAWLAYQLGQIENLDASNSPPFASAVMYLHGVGQQKGLWFILHPAHIQVHHDHMVMADRRTLALTESESRSLFNAAQASFDDAGKTVVYGNPTTWFVRADDWKDLVTASPDMACGRNLSHWMPEGPGESAWRKLLNEVQMVWHTHPVNAARQARGEKIINGLWLWAGAVATLPNFPAIVSYTNAYGFDGRMQAFGQFFQEDDPDCRVDHILAHPPEHGLVFLDALMAPALASDWNSWRSAYKTLETEWFTPLLEALRQRKIERLTLNLSNDVSLKTFVVDRTSQFKFWIRNTTLSLLK